MKDYACGSQKNFILKFKETKKHLIVYTADGKKTKIENTKKNKENLLIQMERQVKEEIELLPFWEELLEKQKYLSLKYISIGAIFSIATIILLPIVNAIPVILAEIALSYKLYKSQNKKPLYKDLKKNILALENKDVINEEKNNDAVLLQLTKSTEKKIENTVTFTINDAEQFTFEEMNELVNRINTEQYYKEKVNYTKKL